jgi:hypothetical protein
MAGNLLSTIRLPISLIRSKHRIAALRKFRWLQHLSPIPDHSFQRDLNEAALRQTLRVAGQVPSTRQKRRSKKCRATKFLDSVRVLRPGAPQMSGCVLRNFKSECVAAELFRALDVVEKMVDERGFEPPASSLRTGNH